MIREVISFRASLDERQALLLIAREERRRPSEAMRELVRAEAKRRGLWPPANGGQVRGQF